jgi:hypothetical protein
MDLHSFFDMAGAHNDINVLQQSLVFSMLAEGNTPFVSYEGNTPLVSYEVMCHTYTKGYYLADGIYLELPIFMKTRCDTKQEKYSWFAKEQEACRKDVERAFGVLQSRWAIVWHPARQWDIQRMWEIITVCVIMHNMIVEKKRDDSVYHRGGIFKVSWLLQTMDRYPFRIFSMHMMRFNPPCPP